MIVNHFHFSVINFIFIVQLIIRVSADVSHLSNYYNHHQQAYPHHHHHQGLFSNNFNNNLYGVNYATSTSATITPPPFPLVTFQPTPPTFQLPEIVVNRNAASFINSINNGGYHYPKPDNNVYIPVTSNPHEPQHYVPPAPIIPPSLPSPSPPPPPDTVTPPSSQFLPEIPSQNFPEPPPSFPEHIFPTSPSPVFPLPSPDVDQPQQGYLPPPPPRTSSLSQTNHLHSSNVITMEEFDNSNKPIDIIINYSALPSSLDDTNYRAIFDKSNDNKNNFNRGFPTIATASRPFESTASTDKFQGSTSQELMPFEGYTYPKPEPPSSGYLPPPPSASVSPSSSVFDGSIRSLKDLGFFRKPKSAIHLQLNEMRCVSNANGYFRAILTPQTNLKVLIPVIDNDDNDLHDDHYRQHQKQQQQQQQHCNIQLLQSKFVININAENFHKCHVKYCDQQQQQNYLCLRIRFPIMHDMKTAADSILTLKCKVQEKIATKQHTLKMAISDEAQSRNYGIYAHGGSQQPFRTHMTLFRKSTNGFTRTLQSNDLVQLGEELQLRAHVRSGDGWNYTRLSDVHLQRISPITGEILNTATLITSSGCLNSSMRFICPLPPIYEPPLGYRLSFKAIMFDGMKSGDEISMNIKITACLEQKDCFVNPLICNDSNDGNDLNQILNRKTRNLYSDMSDGNQHRNDVNDEKKMNSAEINNLNNNKNDKKHLTEYSEIATISFRVEIPSSLSQQQLHQQQPQQNEKLLENYTNENFQKLLNNNYFDHKYANKNKNEFNIVYLIIGCIIGFIFIMSVMAILIYYKFQ